MMKGGLNWANDHLDHQTPPCAPNCLDCAWAKRVKEEERRARDRFDEQLHRLHEKEREELINSLPLASRQVVMEKLRPRRI
ncbi:hypothetical protein DWU98_09340 [Dyella monticola]|uniref:Uncharacterized protein n=1 Tax=Dyella monticola TaxID=1927958 RepID=A0A370X1V1_9GAMM|nr:hypothetical protein DWU98_09340 [Dyella monticola]